MEHQLQKIHRPLRKHFRFRVRWLAKLYYPYPSFFGLRDLDRKLIEVIDNSPNYYIEIGANDGVSQSNTLALELFYGWRGLLIEPISSTFGKLKKNRSKRRNFLLNSACVSRSYAEQTVDLLYSDLMSVALGLDSDVRDPVAHAFSGKKFLSPQDSTRVETVPATTMTRALEKAGAPTQIGLLSLDVEGAELEVLKGLDFRTYQIDWILVESRQVDRISALLSRNGYAVHSKLSHHDYLFTRKS